MATTTLDTAIFLWTQAIGLENIKLLFGLIIVFIIVMLFIDRFSRDY
jgi:hypothetical protein